MEMASSRLSMLHQVDEGRRVMVVVVVVVVVVGVVAGGVLRAQG
jgi:hypothetical protein